MIARIYAKPAATKPQILMLFALVLATSSILAALPIPRVEYRWIGVVLGIALTLFLGSYVVRHTLVVYEYQLYSDRLVVLRHLFRRVKVASSISHKSIVMILPAADPVLRSIPKHDATVSFGGILDNRFAIVFQGQKKREALLLECGYPFAKSISKIVAEYQAAHKGV
ncbi:MAG: hypothetical protein E7428_04725 [Ruminococcaceae bacterium]|nr:hypothetical protein [Oscillospiraceae bacterium]